MTIQVITSKQNLISDKLVTISNFKNLKALDNYDINIVDLSNELLWYHKGSYDIGLINDTNDLFAVKEMIATTIKSQIIYVYPMNYNYYYCYMYNSQNQRTMYNKSMQIKEMINNNDCIKYIGKYIYSTDAISHLIFEPTKTRVGDKEYPADFHFVGNIGLEDATKSVRSEKVTTIKYNNNLYITTLDFCKTIEDINNFVNSLFFEKVNDETPEWVKEYNFGNDKEERELISKNTEKIEALQKSINDAEKQLELNNRYKSILFTNGNQLVEVVFEILQYILECDLSNFVDEKREDFLIEKDKKIFIGEIKGVSTNVKNPHISQLDVHYQTYIEDMQDDNLIDSVHPILIINPLRTIELSKRDSIHEKQIKLACDRGSLIIETVTLLKIFELYQEKKLTTEQIIKVLTTKTGLLEMSDFN